MFDKTIVAKDNQLQIEISWFNTLETDKNENIQSVSHIWDEFNQNGKDAGPYYPELDTNLNRAVGTWPVANKIEATALTHLINTPTFKGKNKKQQKNFCAFCKNNRALPTTYMGHNLKNCPRLRAYMCPTCGNHGHTVRYCPQKKIITPEDLAIM